MSWILLFRKDCESVSRRNGDDLWDLAKKYMTTEESIQEMNGLESDKIKAGDKLLIFKENMSIL